MQPRNYLEPAQKTEFSYRTQLPPLPRRGFIKPRISTIPEPYYSSNFNPRLPSMWLGLDRFEQNLYKRSNFFDFQREYGRVDVSFLNRPPNLIRSGMSPWTGGSLLGKRSHPQTLHIPKTYQVQPGNAEGTDKPSDTRSTRRKSGERRQRAFDQGFNILSKPPRKYGSYSGVYASRNVQILARRVRSFWVKKNQSYPFAFRHESMYSIKFKERRICFKMIKMDYNFKIVNPGRANERQ